MFILARARYHTPFSLYLMYTLLVEDGLVTT
jgi:hypothetical protein